MAAVELAHQSMTIIPNGDFTGHPPAGKAFAASAEKKKARESERRRRRRKQKKNDKQSSSRSEDVGEERVSDEGKVERGAKANSDSHNEVCSSLGVDILNN